MIKQRNDFEPFKGGDYDGKSRGKNVKQERKNEQPSASTALQSKNEDKSKKSNNPTETSNKQTNENAEQTKQQQDKKQSGSNTQNEPESSTSKSFFSNFFKFKSENDLPTARNDGLKQSEQKPQPQQDNKDANELKQLRNELKELRNKATSVKKLEDELQQARGNIAKLNKQCEEMKKENNDMSKYCEELQMKIDSLEKETAMLETIKKDKKAIEGELKISRDSFDKAKKLLKKSITNNQKAEASKSSESNRRMSIELEKVKAEEARLRKTVADLQSKLSTKNTGSEDTKAPNLILNNNLSNSIPNNNNLKLEIEKLKSDKDKIQMEKAKLEKLVKELNAEMQRMFGNNRLDKRTKGDGSNEKIMNEIVYNKIVNQLDSKSNLQKNLNNSSISRRNSAESIQNSKGSHTGKCNSISGMTSNIYCSVVTATTDRHNVKELNRICTIIINRNCIDALTFDELRFLHEMVYIAGLRKSCSQYPFQLSTASNVRLQQEKDKVKELESQMYESNSLLKKLNNSQTTNKID